MTYQRGWRRGTVIGATSSPDVAVVRLDEDASELDRSVQWAERGPDAGQNLAILGFPGIEGGEFNLVVGTADAVDETTEGVPSFEVVRALSGRTGTDTSGDPSSTLPVMSSASTHGEPSTAPIGSARTATPFAPP